MSKPNKPFCEFCFSDDCDHCEKLKAYKQGREDALNRVLDILHNNYEVRNVEQNAFMDRLCMLVIKMDGKERTDDRTIGFV